MVRLVLRRCRPSDGTRVCRRLSTATSSNKVDMALLLDSEDDELEDLLIETCNTESDFHKIME